jgi:hypothetical protein
MKRGLLLLVATLVMQNQLPSTRYFPEASLDERKDLSEFREQWYSKQLTALEEPSLLEVAKDKTAESYRFTWLRTFHHPVSVRLDILGDGSGVLIAKMASGAGGYDPGKVILNEKAKLAKQQIDAFLLQLRKAGFWTLPTMKKEMGDDGAEWILEGVKTGNYHVVDRWSPEKGPVRDVGLYMMHAGKLKISKKEIY